MAGQGRRAGAAADTRAAARHGGGHDVGRGGMGRPTGWLARPSGVTGRCYDGVADGGGVAAAQTAGVEYKGGEADGATAARAVVATPRVARQRTQDFKWLSYEN